MALSSRATTQIAAIVAVILGVSAAPYVADRLDGSDGRPADAQPQALSAPPEVETSGPHAFMDTVDGRPVRYDPCAPIHLVINQRRAVDDADRMVAEAIDSIEAATGLRFTIDGTTDDEPSFAGSAPGARGPVVLGWSDPDEVDDLEGSVAGVAGSVSDRGSEWYDTGSVALDGPQIEQALRGPGGWESARAVVLHELGHLVGLSHVDARGELMQAKAQRGVVDWGPGDREGLAALGGGECRDY